jgi:hypothetical protein
MLRLHHHDHNSQIFKRGVPTDHWRAVIDNFVIEFLAALFINMSAVMYGGMKTKSSDVLFSDPWTQIIPALVMGLVMMTLKDDDFFFPDCTQTITLLMWSVGAYDNWVHPIARIMGQTVAIGVTIWLCKDIIVPTWASLGRLPMVIFGSELISTIIEHMAIVYLFLPLLPASIHSQMNNAARRHVRVQAKNHADTDEPTNHAVMHASIAFSGLHWCLRLTFLSEMNPGLTLIKSTVWTWQVNAANSTHVGELVDEIWSECLMAIWGQAVGFLIALVYIIRYLPLRKSVANIIENQ